MKKRLFSAALLAALAVPSLASAQDAAAPNTGALHFGADFFYTTSYFFRGYNQEDTGLIFQPNVYGTLTAIDSDDFDLDLKAGLWNSLHENQTAGDGIWYEADFYAAATLKFMNAAKANVYYTAYTYPEDAFETVHELGVSVSYDWTNIGMEGLNLSAEVGAYFELEDGNGSEDTYGEIKLIPSYKLTQGGFLEGATLSVPMILGLSIDDYYLDSDGDNELLGYGQIGVALGIPLTGIPARYGSWTLTGQVNYLYLFADSAELSNDGGENDEIQGMVGLSVSY